jgi:hypothetical protein
VSLPIGGGTQNRISRMFSPSSSNRNLLLNDEIDLGAGVVEVPWTEKYSTRDE